MTADLDLAVTCYKHITGSCPYTLHPAVLRQELKMVMEHGMNNALATALGNMPLAEAERRLHLGVVRRAVDRASIPKQDYYSHLEIYDVMRLAAASLKKIEALGVENLGDTQKEVSAEYESAKLAFVERVITTLRYAAGCRKNLERREMNDPHVIQNAHELFHGLHIVQDLGNEAQRKQLRQIITGLGKDKLAALAKDCLWLVAYRYNEKTDKPDFIEQTPFTQSIIKYSGISETEIAAKTPKELMDLLSGHLVSRQ